MSDTALGVFHANIRRLKERPRNLSTELTLLCSLSTDSVYSLNIQSRLWPSLYSMREVFKKGFVTIINAGQGVEKREPSYTVGGNVNLCSHYGKQYEGSLKWSLGIYPDKTLI